MQIHTYREEDFGYIVAFRDGYIGLYGPSAGDLCSQGASSDELEPHKLTTLEITRDFHLRSPLIVWLEVTRACNLRCRHCFVSAADAQPDELSGAQLLALIDELAAKRVFCLVFSGGEPFMRPDFLPILERALALGFVVSVISNGLVLTDELVRRLPHHPNLRITLSLDNLHYGDRAPDEPPNAKLAYLRSRLELLQAEGIGCHVSATMTRQNLAELKDTFSWLSDRGIGYRGIPCSAIGRGASAPELPLTAREVKAAAELWAMDMLTERALQASHPVLTFDQCYDFAFNLVFMARACKGARFICYVCANGDIYPCTTCVGADAYCQGNLTRSSFWDIWHGASAEFRTISRWDRFDHCASCALSEPEYFCTNRCPPLSQLRHGSPHVCGATEYDRASLAYRTRMLPRLEELVQLRRRTP